MRDLFVCRMNYDRSLVAEIIANSFLFEKDIEVKSCGLSSKIRSKLSVEMRNALYRRYYKNFDDYIGGKKINKEYVDWADRIFTFQKNHMDIIKNEYDDSKNKTFFLGEYLGINKEILSPSKKIVERVGFFSKLEHFIYGTVDNCDEIGVSLVHDDILLQIENYVKKLYEDVMITS